MRRAIVAIIGTAVGTAALVGLKAGLPNAQADNTAAGGPLAPSGGAPAVGGAGGGTTGPTGQPTAKPTAPGAASRSGRSAAPAPAGGTGLHQGTFNGTVAQTPYGPVQVRITVSGARMTDVTAVQLPRTEARSLDIDRTAVPTMRQEALKAQSANINAVSGATYTSQGYRTSLQAALDAAKRG